MYSQFKDKKLTTETAEAYAKMRLGLDDEWCVYSWSACVDRYGAEHALDDVGTVLDDEGEITVSQMEDIYDDLKGSRMLPVGQLIVYLVNAPNIKIAREGWDYEIEMEHKVCLIDWNLVQELAHHGEI